MRIETKYPFNCRVCGILVSNKRKQNKKNSRGHQSGKCTLRCDGIARDLGGWPIDPELRKKHGVLMSKSKSIKKQIRNISRSDYMPKPGFYESRQWQDLRYLVIKKHGRKCHACGETKKQIHVDHIKPRSKFPDLELVENNLQILCIDCNIGKSNIDETDWRPKCP